MRTKGTCKDFAEVMWEYFKVGHTEQVLLEEEDSPHTKMYYLPIHTVQKDESTTSKLCIVFNVFARTASGSSLNNHLLGGLQYTLF